MRKRIILIICCIPRLCSCSNLMQNNIYPDFVSSYFESEDQLAEPYEGLDLLAEIVELTEDNLVGLWRESSFLAAGWHDRYFLYDDMTFRFEYNKKDLDKKFMR